MKNRSHIHKGAACSAILVGGILTSPVAEAAVVSVLDVGGDVNITNDMGSFSSAAMQALITTTNDLDIAGILDSEGSFGDGNFSNDSGALSDKITGASRYGRDDGVSSKASGSRWGFISGNEVWTPDAGLTHFGLITTTTAANNQLNITVTYSDTSTELVTAEIGQTNWVGFHKSGQTITSILMDDGAGGAFDNYDDVSLAFIPVPEPSSVSLLGLAALGFCMRRQRS